VRDPVGTPCNIC